MQTICLEACHALGITTALARSRTVSPSNDEYQRILRSASKSATMSSHVQALLHGPKLRGKVRHAFNLIGGSRGDVYYCVLRAIAADPAKRSFRYNELMPRVLELVTDSKKPAGSAVSGACAHMARIASEKFPDERFLDWDSKNEVLDVIDPYFWFYLRWSDCLGKQNSGTGNTKPADEGKSGWSGFTGG